MKTITSMYILNLKTAERKQKELSDKSGASYKTLS